MAFRMIRIVLLLACLPLAGCGTVSNLAAQKPGQGGVSPFGGVRHDLLSIKQAANGESAVGHPGSERALHPHLALMLVCAADLPLSLIGDVLTWPYTVTYTYINQPTPVPPVLLPQIPPVFETPADGRPENPAPESLPEPKKLPEKQ